MTTSLPRSTPSDQSVDAAGILAFLDAAEAAGMDFHSIMLLRHGRVVAEGWWAPYTAGRIHLLYSLSKSFASSAIGIAEFEGLLSIDDPVAKFFPEKVPAELPHYLADLKVRHLLAMASGHAEDTIGKLITGGPDLVRTFLSIPPDKEPGTLFCYNQGCTYTLSAIITKLTGQRLIDYLRPRFFEPLGIERTHWLHTEEGVDQGFSGLHAETESVAKLGQLYLQGGWWNGGQIVPRDYARTAHVRHVDNAPSSDNPDWQQGYGFQFWTCRHDAYRGDGAYGQFCVVIPEADAVIACTAQISNMQAEIDLFWKHLLPALSGDASPDPAADRYLAGRLSALSTATIGAVGPAPDAAVTFALDGELPRYAEKLGAVRVRPAAGAATLLLTLDGAEHALGVRPGTWTEGELPGIGELLPPVGTTGGWVADDEFAADIVFLTSPHRLQVRAHAGGTPSAQVSWYAAPL